MDCIIITSRLFW